MKDHQCFIFSSSVRCCFLFCKEALRKRGKERRKGKEERKEGKERRKGKEERKEGKEKRKGKERKGGKRKRCYLFAFNHFMYNGVIS